jgi:soluble lytic murein transglycosylase-like protein
MNIIIHKIIFSLLTICFIFNIHAYDEEIYESNKCDSLFGHFEQKFKIPQNILRSIALKESGKKHSKNNNIIIWPWTVNVEGKGYYFRNKKEAIKFVKNQIKTNKEIIDVGCMQINLKHHINAFDSIDKAFEPQYNISYGAEFLRKKYEQTGCWHKAIAHYHSATFPIGNKYKNDIVKIVNKLEKHKTYSKNNNSKYFLNRKKYKSNLMVPIYHFKN